MFVDVIDRGPLIFSIGRLSVPAARLSNPPYPGDIIAEDDDDDDDDDDNDVGDVTSNTVPFPLLTSFS